MDQKTKMGYTSEKGITLIALVITIIVLLILAGVTLSMLLKKDGIVVNAMDAKEMTNIESTKQSIKLAISNIIAKDPMKAEITVDANDLKVAIENQGVEKVDVEKDDISGEYTITIDNEIYYVTKTGELK